MSRSYEVTTFPPPAEPVSGPTIDAIRRTRHTLGDRVRTTPVWNWRSDALHRVIAPGTDVILKLELWQNAGSFKARGALAVMLTLSPEQLARGVTAVSAGNHAIAVSYTARALGTSAKVVMPRNANPARVAKCRELGAEVVLADDVHDAFRTVRAIESDEGRAFVHPFEGPNTVLGTATVGLEWIEQAPGLDAVIVPVGGGGLCAGIATAVKQLAPNCDVLAVEPVGADSMYRSFVAGSPQAIDGVHTIADSLGAPHAAPYTFALCRQNVDAIALVDDDELKRAMRLLFEDLKFAVEPACAAATAALCGPFRERLAGRKVGVLLCGSNFDADTFHRYIVASTV